MSKLVMRGFPYQFKRHTHPLKQSNKEKMSETFLRPKKVFFKPLKALPNGSGVLENFPNCFELDLLLTTREMMLTAVTEKGLSQRISRLSAKTLK